MKVSITIDCDNAGFEESPAGEVARILRKLADDMTHYERLNGEMEDRRTLRDINGNTVGQMEVSS